MGLIQWLFGGAGGGGGAEGEDQLLAE